MSEAAMEESRDRIRVDAPLKVAGLAPYAYEHELEDTLFLAPVLATIAKGRITAIDEAAARAVPGVRLGLTHANAPRIAPTLPTLTVLRKPRVRYRGEIVAAVVAVGVGGPALVPGVDHGGGVTAVAAGQARDPVTGGQAPSGAGAVTGQMVGQRLGPGLAGDLVEDLQRQPGQL